MIGTGADIGGLLIRAVAEGHVVERGADAFEVRPGSGVVDGRTLYLVQADFDALKAATADFTTTPNTGARDDQST